MGNIFNDDFREFIDAFNKNEVRYVLVGGMAVILNGYIRSTGDMDVWVEQTPVNYDKITRAFLDFGMPVFDMTADKFMGTEFDVWSFGRDPVRIDVMTNVKGIEFSQAYASAQHHTEDNVTFRFLHVNDLLAAKKAAGRHRDWNDIEQLSKKLG
jgi:predicted nucleotidyltransferase